MTTDDIRHLDDDQLDELAFSTKWRWAVRVLGLGMVVAFMAIVGLFFLRSADQSEALARNAAATIHEDYDRCVQANESRAQLRLLRDFVANPNPVDPATIQDPELRSVIVFQQTRAQQFRTQLGPAWEPRDCEAERVAAQIRRAADPSTTR